MSKLDRRNQARQKQQTKHREHQRETNVFNGKDGAPRIVAVVPLCEDGDAAAAVKQLSNSLDVDVDVPEAGVLRTEVDRFKQKIQYIVLTRDLMACLDACRVADFVVLILSPEQEVDELGELIIRSVESQGLSTLLTVVQGLDKVEPPKRRSQIAGSLKSYITHFHPDQEKVHNLDSRQECANLMRSLCTTTPKGVRWREERSWMLVEDVQFGTGDSHSAVLTGVVRGKGLKADRLVQVGDWGDFQIEKVVAAPLSSTKRLKTGDVQMEDDGDEVILAQPTEDQDDLAELAPEEITMGDADAAVSVAQSDKRGVLLDDHHYFSDDETHLPLVPKRLPKGTSSYQAAWFLGDNVSDDGSDFEDANSDYEMVMDTPALPQDGTEGFAPREPTEFAPSEYPQSEMFLDPAPDEEAEELAAFRARKGDEADDDKEFPDEIELHPQVLARERLARYRGLKSLRSSHWAEDEDKAYEPEDWRRLLQVPDYKSSRSQTVREALIGGIPVRTRVQVHLRSIPQSARESFKASQPLTMFSLLRHEHKHAVLNFAITLSSDYPVPIKSKTEMVLQVGSRRLIINPIFSQGGNSSNNVHKFDRYLHPGRSAVATFVGPLTWGSVPALFFKKPIIDPMLSDPQLPFTLVATGTSLPPSSNRVVAKRIILTGHPYKIHKKLVTIRYMFFNREDVEWFKALQLWTRRGRSGYIKESLGTHGYFKATFDGKINPQDSVGVSLYKRVWPRNAITWKPRAEDGDNAPELVEFEMGEAGEGGGVVV